MLNFRPSVPLLLALHILLGPAHLVGQNSGPNVTATYYAEKKGEVEAAVIEALVPVLGHAYAGNARRGLLPAGISAAGFVLLIAGSAELDTGMASLGALGYLGGRIWGIVSAYQTAKDTNADLRRRLGISVGRGVDVGSLRITFTIPTR